MKKFCICMSSLAFFHLVNAQSISNQVVASNGFSASSGGTSIVFTTGELVVKTETSATIILTQGFHQPYLGTAAIKEEENEITISLYPNPTSSLLNIQIKNGTADELETEVYDIFARRIIIPAYVQNETLVLNLESLAAATYQMFVYNKHTNRILRTFKIQKTSNH